MTTLEDELIAPEQAGEHFGQFLEIEEEHRQQVFTGELFDFLKHRRFGDDRKCIWEVTAVLAMTGNVSGKSLPFWR
jgi:hypothetical protein